MAAKTHCHACTLPPEPSGLDFASSRLFKRMSEALEARGLA